MTDSLYIKFTTQDRCSLSKENFVNTIKNRCEDKVPAKTLQRFYVNWYRTNNQIQTEPYALSSLRIMLESKKQRSYANIILSQIFQLAKEYSDKIELFFCDQNTSEVAKTEKFSTIEQILSIKPIPVHIKFIFSPHSRIFHLNLAEAKLQKPIRVEGSEPATGYLCHYYISASNAEEALNYVAADMEKENAFLVGYENITEVLYYTIRELSDYPNELGIFYKSGKVYFSS
ncbi:MAG: hypothetical protein AAGA60_32560 [Cyanobacteria bacterium P01_E01_bin.42]